MNSESGYDMSDRPATNVNIEPKTVADKTPTGDAPAMNFNPLPKTESTPPIKDDAKLKPDTSPVSVQEKNPTTSAELGHAPHTKPSATGELESLPPPKRCTTGSLDLRIRDNHGDPISNLNFRILVKDEIVFRGVTDAQGEIPTINDLKLGSVFEIRIKRDIGGFKIAAIGKIVGEENYACLQSPRTRFCQ